MSIPGLYAGSGASASYQIENSLRLRASASAYLSRTPSASNRQKFTYSCWVKLARTGLNESLFCVDGNFSLDRAHIFPTEIFERASGATQYQVTPTPLYRDLLAHYHFVIVFDTTQAQTAHSVSDSRIRLFVNGVQQITTGTMPAQNYNTLFNAALLHSIGMESTTGTLQSLFDGYLSDIYFIDGQALTPSSFGETNPDGVWVPKPYTGTYGTNGFYLPFDDATSLTTLGYDRSGNANNWTLNNVSLTAGVTYDHMVDTPTNNYATLNPLDSNAGSLGDAALNFGATVLSTARATQALPLSGKWYWEVYISAVGNQIALGVCGSAQPLNNYPYSSSVGYSYISTSGNAGNNAGSVAYGATFTTADLIGVLYDADAATLSFYKNNSTQGTAFSSLSGTLFPCVGYGSSSGTGAVHINFGQRPFTHTPPTGFKALCTANLPAVAITKPASYFNAKTRTGTGASFNVTGQAFQPDLVWTKGRSGATDHALYDAVRGVQKQLESNTTGAETTEATGLTAFNSDGYSGGALAQMNTNAATYIDWMWKANGAGASNTDGSITSTVSANQTAGFSIVTYTGTGANATVGHGLGKAPSFIIIKERSAGASAGINDWGVYHSAIGNTGGLRLDLTNAQVTGQIAWWNNTSPTTTVVSLGTMQNHNELNGNYVAYCFAEVAGFSKFGSYTGNGSADGPFVYCGFRPRFILLKNASAAATNWVLWDTARDTYNAGGLGLYANLAAAEDDYRVTNPDDILSNGFKPRANYANVNGSGNTIIFAAFAEHPFGGSNVAPSPAR